MSQPKVRVLRPSRQQLELRPSDLESRLPEGQRARRVWGYVERQNLEGLYIGIKAVEGGVGRPAIAPEILFALWRYATLDGVGSARAIRAPHPGARRLPLDLRRRAGQLITRWPISGAYVERFSTRCGAPT